MPELQEFLAGARVDETVFALRAEKAAGEALSDQRVEDLPRVNPLTDLYNAVSVLHQVPLGGEDLARYTGHPRLVRATGAAPSPTAHPWSSNRTRARWSGVTTPGSPVGAGTGGRGAAPSCARTPPARTCAPLVA